jgi:hypothetical protein
LMLCGIRKYQASAATATAPNTTRSLFIFVPASL